MRISCSEKGVRLISLSNRFFFFFFQGICCGKGEPQSFWSLISRQVGSSGLDCFYSKWSQSRNGSFLLFNMYYLMQYLVHSWWSVNDYWVDIQQVVQAFIEVLPLPPIMSFNPYYSYLKKVILSWFYRWWNWSPDKYKAVSSFTARKEQG